jgi:hypothetical protein
MALTSILPRMEANASLDRRLRFSLRLLMLVTLIAAAYCAGWTHAKRHYRQDDTPSGYYLGEDIQYFSLEPTFKLERQPRKGLDHK